MLLSLRDYILPSRSTKFVIYHPESKSSFFVIYHPEPKSSFFKFHPEVSYVILYILAIQVWEGSCISENQTLEESSQASQSLFEGCS